MIIGRWSLLVVVVLLVDLVKVLCIGLIEINLSKCLNFKMFDGSLFVIFLPYFCFGPNLECD